MKKSKIPSLIIIIAIVLIIGGLVLIWKHSDEKQTKISQENFKDSDNDGLRDWEEELFHTDPRNPDTDGDGYLDGEEVDSGYNPLIKSPGDKLTFYPLPLGEKYNITKKVLSEEVISSMLDSYFAQKGEYIDDHSIDSAEIFSALIKQSTIKTMSQRALGDIYPILFEKAQETIDEIPEIFKVEITDKNIKISEDNSYEAIKLYVSQLYSFYNSDIFFLQEQGIKALELAFKNRDFSSLDKLIKANDEQIELIKEIIVPYSWKENHKKRLKYTIIIRNIFIALRDIQNDPLKAYIALEEFEKVIENWNNLVKETKILANSQGVDI
jgi:hypothetical protein